MIARSKTETFWGSFVIFRYEVFNSAQNFFSRFCFRFYNYTKTTIFSKVRFTILTSPYVSRTTNTIRCGVRNCVKCFNDRSKFIINTFQCVSFSFNVGLGNLQRSGLRMKTNRREFEDAAEEFMKWTKAGGRVLPGLVKRRQDERALYLSGIN